MTAKAEYTLNGYVCNKCGSRMDAIITPPLSTLGKIKLVCNNCNKHMTKNWQEKFDKEFGGEEKHLSDYYVNDVKQFISDLITQTREETLKELIREYQDNELDGKEYDFYFSIRAKMDILNKLKK